jgi:hypothetical protein
MITTYDLAGTTWYVVSVRFASAYMAKETWERIQQRTRKGKGDMQLGFYRHGPSTDPGRYLTGVTHLRPSAEWLERQLRGTEDNYLSREEIGAFVLRRLDVVTRGLEAGLPSGSYSIRRPERGAALRPDGSMDEPIGQG